MSTAEKFIAAASKLENAQAVAKLNELLEQDKPNIPDLGSTMSDVFETDAETPGMESLLERVCNKLTEHFDPAAQSYLERLESDVDTYRSTSSRLRDIISQAFETHKRNDNAMERQRLQTELATPSPDHSAIIKSLENLIRHHSTHDDTLRLFIRSLGFLTQDPHNALWHKLERLQGLEKENNPFRDIIGVYLSQKPRADSAPNLLHLKK